MLRLLPLLLVVGCALPGAGQDDDDDDSVVTCTYPEDYAEPMEVGRAIAPYRWPEARSLSGLEAVLDLGGFFCEAGDIDWSPFDALLFVSIPAW